MLNLYIELITKNNLTFSGDTMPCDNLVELGRKCDLLIHEATIGDDMLESASLKLHSTVSQAIKQGEKMRAKFTLLTHFSQRFSKTFYLPEIDNFEDFSKIGIAFDSMQIKLAELPILPLFYPCLRVLCSSYVHVLENGGQKTIGKSKSTLQKKIDKIESSVSR